MTLTLPEGATATPPGYCARCSYVDPSGLHAKLGCVTRIVRPLEEADMFLEALIVKLNELYPAVRTDQGLFSWPLPDGETAARIRRAVLQWADDYVPDPKRSA